MHAGTLRRIPDETGGRFYQFRKQNGDCRASVWTNDLDVILRLAVSGPATCAGR